MRHFTSRRNILFIKEASVEVEDVLLSVSKRYDQIARLRGTEVVCLKLYLQHEEAEYDIRASIRYFGMLALLLSVLLFWVLFKI